MFNLAEMWGIAAGRFQPVSARQEVQGREARALFERRRAAGWRGSCAMRAGRYRERVGDQPHPPLSVHELPAFGNPDPQMGLCGPRERSPPAARFQDRREDRPYRRGRRKNSQRIERLDDNPWVIPGKFANTHLQEPQRPWRRIRARAGLDNVRIHDLRHTFASVAVSGGQGLPMIGKMLGHTQVQTTARYAHSQPILSSKQRRMFRQP